MKCVLSNSFKQQSICKRNLKLVEVTDGNEIKLKLTQYDAYTGPWTDSIWSQLQYPQCLLVVTRFCIVKHDYWLNTKMGKNI